jgi:outer membrane protein insertion porin family
VACIAKAAVTYGQYARGYSLSFVEPYLLDYRVALGLDLFQREQLANSYISYGTKTLGFSPRLGFALREDLALQLRYSIYQQEIQLPTRWRTVTTTPNSTARFNPTPALRTGRRPGRIPAPRTTLRLGLWCYSDGEASLPVRKELQSGKTLTSSVGYSLNYNTLDNNKNPTDGLLIDWKQDFAGVGGDVSYIKSAIDAKYYTPLVADIVGLIHLQGGMLNQFGGSQIRMLDHFQMGPNLVRGFAPNGIGPRDLNPFGTMDALGGTKYWALRSNCRCRSGSCRRKSGSRVQSMPTPVDSLTIRGRPRGLRRPSSPPPANSNCTPSTVTPATAGTCTGLVYDDVQRRSAPRSVSVSSGLRSSVRCASTMRFRSRRVS